jgi:hypothetical protein
VPTYFLDANVPLNVSKALALVRDDILYPTAPNCPILTTNVPDAEWLGVAGQQNWVVITKDKMIRHRRWERQALIQAGVRSFCMTSAGGYPMWETLQLLARRWDDIEEIATTLSGPYIYSVTNAGVRPLSIPG